MSEQYADTERLYEHMTEVHYLDPEGYDSHEERVAAHERDHEKRSWPAGEHEHIDG